MTPKSSAPRESGILPEVSTSTPPRGAENSGKISGSLEAKVRHGAPHSRTNRSPPGAEFPPTGRRRSKEPGNGVHFPFLLLPMSLSHPISGRAIGLRRPRSDCDRRSRYRAASSNVGVFSHVRLFLPASPSSSHLKDEPGLPVSGAKGFTVKAHKLTCLFYTEYINHSRVIPFSAG